MRIALIGGRDFQQFPTISYGGVETCVENTAWGLHQAQEDFVCIVPKREVVQDYPFEVIDSTVPPLPGPEANVWPFANSLPDIIKAVKPDVIWTQAFWAAEALKSLNIPIICTFHDFVPDAQRKKRWFTYRDNTWYRFISQFQFNQWVEGVPDQLRERSFYQFTGLADNEYTFGPPQEREDYYLWVAGLNWGWHIKGLSLFIELAKRNPDKRFIAYGTGNPEIEASLHGFNRELGNFEFRGMLKRGEAHRAAFAKARLFVMPTQMPEPFGRTVIESMSKGTPVLGSTNGALPELIKNGVSGYTAQTMDAYEQYLGADYDYEACFEYAKRFHIRFEVHTLIEYSRKITNGGRGNGVAVEKGPRPGSATQIRAQISIESMLSEALHRHQGGNLDEAQQIYNKILMHNPVDADVLNMLGVLSFQKQRLETAQKLLQKAVEIDGSVAEFHLNLGDVRYRRGNREMAADAYKMCLRIDPNMETAKDRLINLLDSPTAADTAPKIPQLHEVVQTLLDGIKGQTYLEVGVEPGEMFSRIMAEKKFGVAIDLMEHSLNALHIDTDITPGDQSDGRIFHTTSNIFFTRYAPQLFKGFTISLAYLKGRHNHAETYRNLLDTLKFLASDGIIVVGHCNPPIASASVAAKDMEEATRMDIPGWTGLWCGDSWKSIVRLRAEQTDLNVFVLDYDCGLAVISRGRPENMVHISPAQLDNLTFADLNDNRAMLLNLKPQEYLYDYLTKKANDR